MRRRELVAAIHDTDTSLVLAVAGGGNTVITDLLDVPGASRTVLEVIVPYAEAALVDLLGDLSEDPLPDPLIAGAVSQVTAGAMAAACLRRARHLDPGARDLLGVACTAALVSDRPKRGDHRAHIAIAGSDGIEHRLVGLRKGALDRAGEDRVVADALLDSIAAACGVLGRLDADAGSTTVEP
jgi:hypothetical protein